MGVLLDLLLDLLALRLLLRLDTLCTLGNALE